MKKSEYKMIHLSGEAGQECTELIEEIRKLIESEEKRKVYNTELVLRGLRVLKVAIRRDQEEQRATDLRFGQTNIIK